MMEEKFSGISIENNISFGGMMKNGRHIKDI